MSQIMIVRVAHLMSWEAQTGFEPMNEHKLPEVRGSVCFQGPALKRCSYNRDIHPNTKMYMLHEYATVHRHERAQHVHLRVDEPADISACTYYCYGPLFNKKS